LRIINPRLPMMVPHRVVATIALFAMSGCTGLTPPPAPMPAACDAPTELFSVTQVLADPTHACFDWVDVTHGRVARSSSASAVIWSTRTSAETALLISAVHTLGVGWFGPAETAIAENLIDPATITGVPRIFLVDAATGAPRPQASPLHNLYNPAIPAAENTNNFADILPRRDFYFGVIDDQLLAVAPLVETPEPLRPASPDVYDPQALTATAPTYVEVAANELVLLMGYPSQSPYNGTLTAGVGQVLDDADARAAIAWLAQVGDVEGEIAYEPAVEMIIAGRASGGMSGGGVFDQAGRLVGVIVRASDPRDGGQYVRAVRMGFAVDELRDAFDALAPQEQAGVAPYLEAPTMDESGRRVALIAAAQESPHP
jgi:hypothetical protein